MEVAGGKGTTEVRGGFGSVLVRVPTDLNGGEMSRTY